MPKKRWLIAAGPIWIGTVLLTSNAFAGCTQGNNTTPPPPQQYNFSHQTFGQTNGITTQYFFGADSSDGCAGAAGGYQQDGGSGGNGQFGVTITSANTALTFNGASVPPDYTLGASISSYAGSGGPGGQAGYLGENIGGAGGTGGDGGAVSVGFNATFSATIPLPGSGSGVLAADGLGVQSIGGNGGTGGPSTSIGAAIRQAGPGGPGGSTQPLTITASGSYTASFDGIGAVSNGGNGGAGGYAYAFNTPYGGAGGQGGAGGTSSVQWTSGTVQAGNFGIFNSSSGGAGGDGGGTGPALSTIGGNAGAGGNGGAATVTLSGGVLSVLQPGPPAQLGAGIFLSSVGGPGGNGGLPGGALGAGGGSGGNGGNGGLAAAIVNGAISFTGSNAVGSIDGAGVLVQSNGGLGGQGGDENSIVGQGGGGGVAGSGGPATLTLGGPAGAGTIQTFGNFAHGAVVQSVGGAGGDGGQANFSGSGGSGGAGGAGGTVTVNGLGGRIVTMGNNSAGVLAQSIGGGGGSGGDANGIEVVSSYVIGGNGGQGGNGGGVHVNLGNVVIASSGPPSSNAAQLPVTLGGGGVLAQSIGGAGGNAGSATSTGGGLISVVVGGTAGGGGDGGGVQIGSAGLVTTFGDHAAGLQAQSIGGGGGKGGSVTNFSASPVPTAAIAIGGRGGPGGAGGPVSVSNTGQVATYGADAIGVLMQSVGGGGGSGGAAAARAVSLSPSKYIPAISIAVATGGAGGGGGPGGAVTLDNTGLITTGGDGAVGVMAQSVGGGGGTGGDSTAASYANGRQSVVNISVSVAVGGQGGNGGSGETVSLTNAGVIATAGQDAYGLFAQSVGGGGGLGGGGDATSTAGDAKGSFATAVSVGGSGGGGGDGGMITLMNTGAVTTRGDGSDAMFAQSVGGGGGAAGGGVATAAGGKLAIAVGVGGNGGAGGNGHAATAQNSGSLITRGTAAIGLSVQSIGGGGGKAGKGGATAGGVSPLSSAQALFDTVAAGLNLDQGVTNLGDGILQIGQTGENIKAAYDELAGIFAQPQAGAPEEGTSTMIHIAVSVGGQGGTAGSGGAASATNIGAITTFGAQSDGIFAQSVGGGGGDGGAASSTGSASDDTQVQSSVAVGGKGGGGGDGGPVTVANNRGGVVLTQGVAAFGIYAQSVGGGGGEGSLAGTVNGSLKSLGVSLGGNGGTGGQGGAVTITTGDGTGDTTIITTGKHGIALFAQSVGGGGGLVRTMTTDETFDPSKIIINPQGRVADVQGLSISLGGQNGIGGNGGAVQITIRGPVTTQGLDAHGILAQSIGGGGGMVVGGIVNIPPGGVGGNDGGSGAGGTVLVQLQPGTRVSAAGSGAYGVLAQSIGGGGGVAGDLSIVATYQLGTANVVKTNAGDGGAVSVTLDGASVQTAGQWAPAIFAQSIGGGGGLVSYNVNDGSATNVQARGTAGGNGTGGAITVSLVNSQVVASGLGAAGILAQSDGKGSGAISITIDAASTVQGGFNIAGFPDDAAIRLLGGTANVITNAGLIRGDATASGGTAILTDSPKTNTIINNSGRIVGDVILNGGDAITVNNEAGGVIAAPTTINLSGGVLRNAGTLYAGGISTIGQTTLTGNLIQTTTGAVVIDVDPRSHTADLLAVTGTATLGGTIRINPLSLAKGVTGPVITASGGLSGAPLVQGPPSLVISQTGVLTNNGLAIATNADFRGADPAATNGQRSVSSHLQHIWDSGDPGFDAGIAALAGLGTQAAYAQALDALSGRDIAAVASTRFEASQDIARDTLGCPAAVDGTSVRTARGCGWVRAAGTATDSGSSRDFSSYRARASMVRIGGQTEIAPDFELAASVGYETGRVDGDDSAADARTETGLLTAGLRYRSGRWTADSIADGAYGGVRTQRMILGGRLGTASAKTDAADAGMHLRTGYTVSAGALNIEPALELDAVSVRVAGYTERGAAPFNLRVRPVASTVLAATPVVRLSSRLFLSSGLMAGVYVEAGLSVLRGDGFGVDARFASVGPAAGGFRSKLDNARAASRFTAGIELARAGGLGLRVAYNGRVSGRQTENSGQAVIVYEF